MNSATACRTATPVFLTLRPFLHFVFEVASMPQLFSISRFSAVTLSAALLVSSGCASKDVQKQESSVAVTPMNMSADSTGMMAKHSDSAMAGMAMGNMVMTGDADRDFLRMMTDHHMGLIAMAHKTIESKDKLTVKTIAERLDTEQDAEMDRMMTMLEKNFKDPYAAKITADNQLMLDQLKGKTGKEYDQTFLNNVITHHEQALKMIDAYLPTAKNADLKAMAQKMKAVQSKEITEFKAKVGK